MQRDQFIQLYRQCVNPAWDVTLRAFSEYDCLCPSLPDYDL